MNQKEIQIQNKTSWDTIADDWFGTTALPIYGCKMPTEEELMLFGNIKDKKVLDIGCGSGHSLLYYGERGAAELWGLDLSTKQIQNAETLLLQNEFQPKLFVSPMEEDPGLPKEYFDAVYSIYAMGWTTDLDRTLILAASYLKHGGILIFSWDHPFMHCVEPENGLMAFKGSYHEEGLFNFEKGGCPVSLYNRKMSTYVNAVSKAGFVIERMIEETDTDTFESQPEFSSTYYSSYKAKLFPLSFVIKARKL
ncbi:MAG: methyltransferase type 11 [Clostridia bacterium]|jgi:SAM-dependent methyltransferase|nr:methyltransferase type 11 [Clostridia bacterium]